jgi:hypothetical protein
MATNVPKLKRWRRLLFLAGVLVGLPLTGWAIGERNIWVAAIGGVLSSLAVLISFTVRRCPNCRERLFAISYPATHCPKCGKAYT